MKRQIILSLALLFSACLGSFAQNAVKAVLVDATNGTPLGFATVSLTPEGKTKASNYVLSDENGNVEFSSVKNGKFTFKAELLGNKTFSRNITMAKG